MLLDSDFDIIKRFKNFTKFAGLRRVKFTSNINCVEYEDGTYQVATANVIDDNDELMYRVTVVFPNEDVVHYAGTYYGPSYSIPAGYDKHGKRLFKNGNPVGRRIKGMSYEIKVTETRINESSFYNRKTGNHEITRNYRLFTTAATLRKIEPIHTEMYRLVIYDTTVVETKHIAEEVKNFDGRYRVTFTTNVYAATFGNDTRLLAKAIVNGQEMVIGMSGIDMKTIEPSRWAPYYIYRPIINGRGCTIKDHTFDIYVNETEVYQKNKWNEELNATVSTNKYILSINEIKKVKRNK